MDNLLIYGRNLFVKKYLYCRTNGKPYYVYAYKRRICNYCGYAPCVIDSIATKVNIAKQFQKIILYKPKKNRCKLVLLSADNSELKIYITQHNHLVLYSPNDCVLHFMISDKKDCHVFSKNEICFTNKKVNIHGTFPPDITGDFFQFCPAKARYILISHNGQTKNITIQPYLADKLKRKHAYVVRCGDNIKSYIDAIKTTASLWQEMVVNCVVCQWCCLADESQVKYIRHLKKFLFCAQKNKYIDPTCATTCAVFTPSLRRMV